MEGFLLVLLMVAACVAVGWSAKTGAEREARRREQRWAQRPAMPGVAGPQPTVGGRAPGSDETVSRSAATTGSQGATATRSAGAAPPAAKPPSRPAARPRPTAGPVVDINQAGAEELRSLPGVGVRAAERIVAHRDQHGPFGSVGELETVEGFDHHRVARLASSAKV